MTVTPGVAARADVRAPAATGHGLLAPGGWAVWQLPAVTRCLVLVVTAIAVVGAVAAVWSTPLVGGELVTFAVLLSSAAASVEATRRVPEPAGMNANDMLGAWCVPIAVLLPPGYALLAAAVLMVLTQWRVRRIAAYKRVYSAAAIGLAHAAASAAFHALPGRWTDWATLVDDPAPLIAAVAAAGVLAKAANAVLVAMAVKTADPEARWAGVFVVGNGQLEVAEVCTGALIALAAGVSPVLVLIALPPVLVLQRGSLYAQLHAAARTDVKTGLLNAAAWEREAAAGLATARRLAQPASVLLLDIDYFKRVNDTHGHLVGDDVLRAVSGALRAQLRDGQDLLGRFGGEEFAVFLPGVDAAEARRAAERLRRGVADLVVPVQASLVQVTVSVGVAVADFLRTPDPSVPELLAHADLGLHQAKTAGRDRIHLLTRPDRRAHGG